MTKLLMNYWYLAAWSKDVTDKPLKRKICNRPMAIYRKSDGGVAALQDRCPHRFAPLSMGYVDGDNLVCPYHGLQFDCTGACAVSPFGDPPAAARVNTYPVVEKDNGIWVWPGDPNLANPKDVPDYSDYLYKPTLDCIRMHAMLNSHIMIGVENLLDLTHAATLHRTTFDSGEYNNFLDSKHHAHFDGDQLNACWDMYYNNGADVNQAKTTWVAPGRMSIASTVDDKGRKLNPPWLQLHIYTPETETTTHYFTAERFDPTLESPEHAEKRAQQLSKLVFENEDNPIMAAIQAEMGEQDFWDMKPVLLVTDKACVMARRHYDKLLQAEQHE